MSLAVPMKIIFCDNSLRELLNFRKDIINYYASLGYDVVLVAPENIKCQFEYSNIMLIPVQMNRSGKNPFNEVRYFFNLMKIYKKEKPDYIFHYTIKPNIYGTFAAKICGIHSTAMIAGLGYVFNRGGVGNIIARTLYRFAMKYPDYVFVLNSYNKQLLIDKSISSPEKIILLSGGEGVNLDYFKTE